MTAILALLQLAWANKKEILYVLAIIACVWAGWWMRGLMDDREKLAEIELLQKQAAALQAGINKNAAQYESDRQKAATELRTSQQQLRAYRAQHSNQPVCPVNAGLVQILNR